MSVYRAFRLGALGLAVSWVLVIVAASSLQSLLPLADPLEMHIMAIESPPGGEHWLGTDKFGRDIFARLATGAQVSLKFGLLAPLIGLLIGTLIGFAAAWSEGWTDWSLSALNDAVFALPGIAVIAVAMHSFDNKEATLIVALGALSVPAFARVSRNLVRTQKKKNYVLTARMVNGAPLKIFLFLILPNIRRPLMAYCLLIGSMFIVLEGSLSFLGLGIPTPAPSWGSMIAEGRDSFRGAPHTLLIPVAVLTFTVLAFNVIGEALKHARS